jgi:hypothetical protein
MRSITSCIFPSHSFGFLSLLTERPVWAALQSQMPRALERPVAAVVASRAATSE